MAFRTVVIDKHSKLEYSLEYLVFKTPEETKRVLLDEIHTLIIQSTAVSLTTSLLSELVKRKIKVIFCDEKKNPLSEIIPYYNAHNTSSRLKEQIGWEELNKDTVWQYIVKEKINNQQKSLRRKQMYEAADMLNHYIMEVEVGDITNREGHSAKVYFNNIFGKGFSREQDCLLNKYLNYGYTILLSQFNRSIVAYGYLTQLGIHHKGETNQFNLSSDLIEPFRFLIDDIVENINENNWKDELVNVLAKEVTIGGKIQTLPNAINLYCTSVFNALKDGDVAKIKFIENDV